MVVSFEKFMSFQRADEWGCCGHGKEESVLSFGITKYNLVPINHIQLVATAMSPCTGK
jgi:hypothetical protein